MPVAKALGSASGTIQMVGFGSPDAIAISSTTLTSCFSLSLLASSSCHAPVAHSTCLGPRFHANHVMPTPSSVAPMPNQGMV